MFKLSNLFSNIFILILISSSDCLTNNKLKESLIEKTQRSLKFENNFVEIQQNKLDPYIVVDLKILMNDKKLQTCPYGYEMASGCGDYGCELKYDVWYSKNIYLCQKKLRVSEMSKDDKMYNEIKITNNKNNCDKSVPLVSDLNLNENKNNDPQYLCAGLLKNIEENKAPINDFYIHINKINKKAREGSYECSQDINQVFWTGKSVYICFSREKNVPFSVKFSNLIMNNVPLNPPQNDNKPSVYDIIQNDNSNGKNDNVITKKYKNSFQTAYSLNWAESYNSKIEVTFDVKIPNIWKLGVSSDLEKTLSNEESKTKTVYKEHNTEFQCKAPAGKVYMCYFMIKDEVQILPYTVDKIITYYDKRETKETIKKYLTIKKEVTKLSSCCSQNCGPEDDKCTGTPLSPDKCYSHSVDHLPEKNPEDIPLVYKPELLYDVIFTTSVDYGVAVCPIGYEVFNKGCNKIGCNLNILSKKFSVLDAVTQNPIDLANSIMSEKADYIYLCQKKIKINKFDRSPINVFKININNEDCGSPFLKKSNVELNQGADSAYFNRIYFCYGFDPESKLAPITDFYVYIEGLNQKPKDYECDDTDLNTGFKEGNIENPLLSKEKSKYNLKYRTNLCVKRDSKAPKKIYSKDIKYDFSKTLISSSGNFKNIEISTNGVDSSKEIIDKLEIEKTMLKKFEFGAGVSLEIGVGGEDTMFSASLKTAFKYTNSQTQEWKDTVTNEFSIGYKCQPETFKEIICIFSKSYIETQIPYTGTLVFEDYDGKQSTIPLNGWFDKTSQSLNYRSCCKDKCCTGNASLDKDKPHCTNSPKDILCSDVESCVEPVKKKSIIKYLLVKHK
jgi:hypothetical protein